MNSIYEIAHDMLAEARKGIPPNTCNPFYWEIGLDGASMIFSESITRTIDHDVKMVPRHSWSNAKAGDMTLCGLPAFVSQSRPGTIRLMMAMQVDSRPLVDEKVTTCPCEQLRAEVDEGRNLYRKMYWAGREAEDRAKEAETVCEQLRAERDEAIRTRNLAQEASSRDALEKQQLRVALAEVRKQLTAIHEAL